MTFDITKDFAFCAAHRLAGLPGTHKCSRVHGHRYVVQVRVTAAQLVPPGWITDYADLTPLGDWLAARWDHRWLGAGALLDEDGFKTEPVFESNPTAENLAARFRGWILDGGLPALSTGDLDVAVGVSETPKTWAWSR